MPSVIKRVLFLLCVMLALIAVALTMFSSGYIPANGWTKPQHELIFGMVTGGLVGIFFTGGVLLIGYNLK